MESKNHKLVLPPRMTEIVQYLFQNPGMNYTELAKHFNVSLPRISAIMHNPRVLAAFPILAKKSVTGMIPKTLKVYSKILDQDKDLNVAEKVASKILNSEKILEPTEHKVVHELQMKSISELQKIIDDSKSLPVVSIEAEIVGDETFVREE